MKKILFIAMAVLAVLPLKAAQLSLTRAIPSDGTADVALNTRVILMFSENIATGQAVCRLNGQKVTASITSKMATFELPGLDYSTTYEFVAPKGAFVSTSDATKTSPEVKLSFSTQARPQPQTRVFDAIVAKDGSGNYTTIQAAVNAMPEKRTKPWLVFVKNGYYNEVVRVPETKPYLHLIGEDSAQTVVAYKLNAGWSEGGWFGTDPDFPTYAARFSAGYAPGSQGEPQVIYNQANNFYMENITVRNLWGYEERDFPQALALRTLGDHVALNNCRLQSYQDTWETASNGNNRHYAKNCLIEGHVDFIYDNGDVLFDSCTISIVKNRKWHEEAGWIVAPSSGANSKWGYVFLDCKLVGERKGDSIYLGRPWHGTPKATFIRLQLDDKIVVREEGWEDTWGLVPTQFADWGTRNADGTLADLSKRLEDYWMLNGSDTLWYKVKCRLTDEEAADYTFANIIPGSDAWRPDIMMQPLEAPKVSIEGDRITWNAVDFAICYEIVRQGQFVRFTTDTSYEYSGNAGDYQVRAVNEYGSFGRLSGYATGLRGLSDSSREIVSSEWFDLLGHRLDGDDLSGYGVTLRRDTWSDGKVSVSKTSFK